MERFAVVLLALFFVDVASSRKVAIVGGGIGGASVAYFLRHLLHEQIQIELISDGDIGGRIATVSMRHNGKERVFEAGGSILHPSNAYFAGWLKEFGLSKRENPGEKGVSGIWNGNEFVFMKSSWYLITLCRLYLKYGLDPLRNRFDIGNMLSEFRNIYELLRKGNAYSTVDSMISAVSPQLASLLNKTACEYLQEIGYRQNFIDDVARAAINCNYGQSLEDMNGFVGSVGLAGAASGLYSVNGSNKIIAEKLIETSKAKFIRANVVLIVRDGNKFELFDEANIAVGKDYDYVILAAPLHQSQKLTFKAADVRDQIGSFRRIIATFIEGSLHPGYWSLSEDSDISTIFVSNTSLFYNSVGQLCPVDYARDEPFPRSGTQRVWKVFSKDKLNDEQLHSLFSSITDVKEIDFFAYPDYSKKPEGRPRFRLLDRVCYVNAIEWLASSIEMSAIGGHNCANMLIKDLRLKNREKHSKSEL